jgi:TolA-binding protein
MMLRARMHTLLAQPAPQELSPWLWLAAAAVAMLIVLVLFSARLRGRTDPIARPPSTVQQASLAQQRAVERDMQNLVHELSEMSQRMGAQLDARATRLEQLIREADERLERLERVNNEPLNTPMDADPDLHVTMSSARRITTADADEIDPRHAEIYAMHEQGLTPSQIADQLHRPAGEVELILALRPRGRAVV